MNADRIAERERAVPDGTCVRHILLVTRSFPPLNAVSSLRMYQWAKYWSRGGVRVTVLTTTKHWFSGPLDMDVPPLPDVQVVEVEFLPKPLLRLLARGRWALRIGSEQGGAGRGVRDPAGWSGSRPGGVAGVCRRDCCRSSNSTISG
jgi:hypothetical protein